jgi:hypothetical protein
MIAPIEAVRPLPAGFEALEPFVAQWAGDTTADRMKARCEADMAEIQTFYDAMIQHGEAAMRAIAVHPLGTLPPAFATLSKLLLALAQASIAVELYGQPRAPDTPYPNSIALVRGTAPFG